MKKAISLAVVILLVLSLTACGNSDTDDNAVYGKVTAVEDNEITIELLTQQNSENEGNSTQTTPPEMPSGNNGDSTNGNAQGSDSATPPEKPDGDSANGNAQNNDSATPPEKPDGDSADGNSQGNNSATPPEKPDGDSESGGNQNNGTPPEMQGEPSSDMNRDGMSGNMGNPIGETKTITVDDTSILYKLENEKEIAAELTDITVGAILKIIYSDDEQTEIAKIIIGSEDDFDIDTAGGQNAPGNSSSDVIYGGNTEITGTATESGKTYSSDTADESALLISTSDSVTITNPTVTKSGDSDGGDNCNFYGQNAALLVKDGSVTTITGGTVTTDATGANGVFSYGGNGGNNGSDGDGTTVIISDTVINTTGSGSGGIMTTGGGITKATNLTVTTSGQSSAAIRTDRGGGTVTVDKGTYTTNGLGSPAIYSTADITVSDATLISNLSEGVCIEGLNSITLNNTDLTANNTKCNGNATFYDSIMIYQSMSGDAASGTSHFTMTDGSLTSKNGHVFHITNTNAVITLNSVKIVNEDDDNILLSVCDDGWSGGSNKATLNAENQELNGAVLVGDNSELTLSLSDGSIFTGYINGNIKNANGDTVSTETGTVSVTLDDTSTWTLTADSYVTEFNGDASNIISNGYTLYVNGTALTGTK